MLAPTTIYNRQRPLLVKRLHSYAKKRLRRDGKDETDRNVSSTSLGFDYDRYTASIALYFLNEDVKWHSIGKLLYEAKKIIHFETETGGEEIRRRIRSDVAGIDPGSMVDNCDMLHNRLKECVDSENYTSVNLTLDDKKALIYVVKGILRSKRYVKSAHVQIICVLEEIDPIFRASKFLK